MDARPADTRRTTMGVASKATKKILSKIRATGPRFIYPPYCVMHSEKLPVLCTAFDRSANPRYGDGIPTHLQVCRAAYRIAFYRDAAEAAPSSSKSSYSRRP